jgi:hypothetical protein
MSSMSARNHNPGTRMTAFQVAYGKALIKKIAISRKERLKKTIPPMYDKVFFEGLKWLDKQ